MASQVQVRIGSNTNIKTKIFTSNTTIADAFRQADVTVGAATVYLNGCTIQPGDFNKTFEQLEVGEDAVLVAVVKQDNGSY